MLLTSERAMVGPAAPASASGCEPGPAAMETHDVLKYFGAAPVYESLSTRLNRVSAIRAAPLTPS